MDEQTGPLVVSVCRRLDGMPLAIELAAARLRSLSLAELHDRLDQRFRLLTGGSRTALERQQTLRATVDWSYSLLTGAEQVLLGRLSVFAGSFDLDAAEAVCGFGGLDVLDVAGLLGSLVDKSLVVAEPAGGALRYRLLETIRLFAAERLAEAGDDEAAAVAAAHCAHFLSVAETAAAHLTGPDQGSWLARLDADQANLRRAAEHAAGRPDGTALVLRLGVALRPLLEGALPGRRRPSGCSCRCSGGPTPAPTPRCSPRRWSPPRSPLASLTWPRHGSLLNRRSRSPASWATTGCSSSPSRRCAPRISSPASRRQGVPFGQESVERARQLGDDVLLGREPAHVSPLTIDPARSGPLFAEAIACTERSGDHLINSILHNNAGVAALAAGDIPAARAHLEAAAQAAQQIGQDSRHVSVNLGLVLRAEGDLDGARSTFEAGLRISRRNGDNCDIAYAILGLACLAGDAGDWHRAAALHGVAQAFLDRTGNPWQELDARYRRDSLDQARAHLGDEQFERAYAQGMALSLEKALDLALPRTGPA